MKIEYIFRVLSLVGSLFCISRYEVFSNPFWTLIVFYTIYLFISKSVRDGISAPGIFALHTTMFARYALLPVVFYAVKELPSCAKGLLYLTPALYLMLFEQFCVFCTIEITRNKFNRIAVKPFVFNNKKHNRFIGIIALLLFLVITILFKNLDFGLGILLSGSLQDFSSQNDVLPEKTIFDILVGIIWQVLSIWLYIHYMFKEKAKYDIDGKSIHVNKALFLSFLLILVSFIDQTGLSRWYTIVNSGTAISCLIKFFPDKKKRTLATICIPVILLIAFATLVKNAGFVIGQSSVGSSSLGVFTSDAIDSYFAGPVNVNNAIYVSKLGVTGLGTIVNDALNNMPVINHYFRYDQSTNYLHNLLSGRIFGDSRGDQIIPLIGQSYNYFGIILAPILSIISVVLVRFFDSKFKQENSYLTFVYAFVAIWIGVEPMALNLSICMSWFYTRIIPDYLALKLFNRKGI